MEDIKIVDDNKSEGWEVDDLVGIIRDQDRLSLALEMLDLKIDDENKEEAEDWLARLRRELGKNNHLYRSYETLVERIGK